MKTILIKNAAVIPMDRPRVLKGRFVLIEDGIVVQIGPMAKCPVYPSGSITTINAKDKFLIPGLFDMHTHLHLRLKNRFFALFLAHGVTAIREVGNKGNIFRLRDEVAKGHVLGPRIFAAGPILEGSPPLWKNFSKVIDSRSDAKKFVRVLKKKKADFIKVYHTLDPVVWRIILREARQFKLKVIGHIPSSCDAFDAVAAGQNGIEHISYVGDGALVYRFRGVKLIGVEVDVKRLRVLIKKLSRAKTALCPTLIVGEQMAKLDSYGKLVRMPEARYLPKYYRAVLWNPAHDKSYASISHIPEFRFQNRRMINAVMKKMIPLLQKKGVLMLAGSDTANPFVIPGLSLLQELELLVQSGLTPFEALSAATRNAARWLGIEKHLGTIAEGKIADLVLLNKNPLAHISNVRVAAGVFIHGKYFDRRQLLQKVKIYR